MHLLRNPEVGRQMTDSLALLILSGIGGFFLFGALSFGRGAYGGTDLGQAGGWMLAAALVLPAFLMLLYWTAYTAKRYRRLEQLASQADRILHGERELDLRQYQEGELSVLGNELQKLLTCLLEQADTLQREKVYLGDFMANISHQLKTPLTSLHLLMNRLSREQEEGERIRLFHEGAQLLDRVDWLVNGLLKIARIDAGTAVFAREWVDARELAEAALGPLRIPLELREQRVELVFPDSKREERPGFWGDLAWSTEALGNILKNSMEHTPRGGELRVEARENRLYTELVVEDNGNGIDPQDLPHLFERFYRGKDAEAASVGIGLNLARRIIRKQNGTVKAENRREGGARFCIRFYKGVI